MSTNPFSLEGKTVVVTGASSGIGRACAITCSQMGAKVVLMARNEQRLAETLSQMEGEGHLSVSIDLTDFVHLKECVEGVVAEVGAVDGLVHAAGIEMTKPVKLLTAQDYEEVYRTNAVSGFEIVRHLSARKNMNSGGSIVLISSISGVIGRKGVAAYAASKGAMQSASRAMALELSKRKIRVNCISPGTVMTPMVRNFLNTLEDDARARRMEGFPLGMGEPSDIANACVFLLSDASRWVTGQNLIVDGGYTIK